MAYTVPVAVIQDYLGMYAFQTTEQQVEHATALQGMIAALLLIISEVPRGGWNAD